MKTILISLALLLLLAADWAASTAAFAAKYFHTYPVYLVKKGDTLKMIRDKTGNSIRELMEMNGIQNPERILAGQRIKYALKPNPAFREILGFILANGAKGQHFCPRNGR